MQAVHHRTKGCRQAFGRPGLAGAFVTCSRCLIPGVLPQSPTESPMRSTLSALCLIAAIACCCVFFGPGFSFTGHYDGQEKREVSTFHMGFPSSPWWDYKKTVRNGEPVESAFELHVLSASWLFLIAAPLLFYGWHKVTLSSQKQETPHQ